MAEVREVWSAQVRGDGGRFERARLSVDDAGDFVLETRSAGEGSADRAVIAREDADRLADALCGELDQSS